MLMLLLLLLLLLCDVDAVSDGDVDTAADVGAAGPPTIILFSEVAAKKINLGSN